MSISFRILCHEAQVLPVSTEDPWDVSELIFNRTSTWGVWEPCGLDRQKPAGVSSTTLSLHHFTHSLPAGGGMICKQGGHGMYGGGGVKSRLAGLPGWTINLCLFQSCSDWNCVKLEQGCHQFLLASLSFSSSPGDAQRLHAMDRFCQRPSLHTVLAWRRSRRRKKKK